MIEEDSLKKISSRRGHRFQLFKTVRYEYYLFNQFYNVVEIKVQAIKSSIQLKHRKMISAAMKVSMSNFEVKDDSLSLPTID